MKKEEIGYMFLFSHYNIGWVFFGDERDVGRVEGGGGVFEGFVVVRRLRVVMVHEIK